MKLMFPRLLGPARLGVGDTTSGSSDIFQLVTVAAVGFVAILIVSSIWEERSSSRRKR